MLRLCTLGGLDLSAGGDQVHPLLSQPKRLGLLVYLSAAKSQGYRRRDTLLPLFWPELDQDRARNALRQATYVLRRDLGDGVIRMHGEEELGVDPAKLWVDVTAFETAFAASEYRTAADLYRGDFLEGFFVSGAGAEFDEWVAGERDRLRGLASKAMWIAAETAVRREPEAAAGWIRKALALAPDDELAVRQALDQLVRIGDRAGALHVYHDFRARLDREFSAEPATETKAMGEALRLSHDPAPLPRPIATEPLPDDAPIARAGPPDPGPDFVRLRGNPGRWAVAAVLAGAVVLSAWSLSRVTGNRDRTSLGRVTSGDELLVGDFDARPEDSLTAHALTEVMRARLADSKAIRVVPRPAMEQALARAQLAWNTRVNPVIARDLAVRNGYEVILNGQLIPVGSGYVLSAHLTTVGGVELASASERASSPDALIDALGRLMKLMRSRLGESQESLVAVPPLQQVTTWSIRALELFTQAQDFSHVSRGRGQQPPEFMKVIREALAIDTTFAMAHRRLGAALYNLGHFQESAEAMRAAQRFSHKLSDVERLTVLVSLHLNRREFDQAVAAATELRRLTRTSGFLQNWLRLIYFSSGQYDVAERELPRLGLATVDPVLWPQLRMYQGRQAEAIDSARAVYRRYADSAAVRSRSMRGLLAFVHVAQFAYDSAIVHALPREGVDSGTRLVLAASRFARGEIGQALAIQVLRTVNTHDELGGSSHTAVESFSALAELLIMSDRVSASRRLDRVLADTSYRNRYPANRHIRPVLALALAGRVEDARRELTSIVDASSEDVRAMRTLDFALAQGAIALAERRVPEAIAAFNAARRETTYGSNDVCRVCMMPWLGRAYEAVEQFDSAATVYERYLTTGDPFRVLVDAAWRARILQRLGDLHAQRGDTALAVKRLSEFVELWKNADTKLQPEVEKARRRVAELRINVLADRDGRSPATLAASKR